MHQILQVQYIYPSIQIVQHQGNTTFRVRHYILERWHTVPSSSRLGSQSTYVEHVARR